MPGIILSMLVSGIAGVSAWQSEDRINSVFMAVIAGVMAIMTAKEALSWVG